MAEKLDYDQIEFPVQEKDFDEIEVKNNICINTLTANYEYTRSNRENLPLPIQM